MMTFLIILSIWLYLFGGCAFMAHNVSKTLTIDWTDYIAAALWPVLTPVAIILAVVLFRRHKEQLRRIVRDIMAKRAAGKSETDADN